MKVLVTGPTGLLGNNLVRELLKDDQYEVYCYVHSDRSKKKLEGLPVNIVIGDILDAVRVEEAVAGMDVVFHCAASTKVYPPKDPKIYSVNVDGTRNLIEACIKHNTSRFIHVGTANSFGFSNSPRHIRNEQSGYNSHKIGLGYMDSKKIAQEEILGAVKDRGLNAIIVNPTAMMGAYDHLPSSGQVVLALYQGKVPGYTNGGKNFVAVKDVCHAMISAVSNGRIGECYILGHENMTYHEFFDKVSEILQIKPPRFKFPKWLIYLYGSLSSILGRIFRYKPTISREIAITGTKYFYYDNSKAVKELGFLETPIDEAIKDCYNWFKEEGYL